MKEAGGFFEEEVGVGEGFEADVLPADEACGIDEEGGVEGLVFEVIVGAVGFEEIERGIGEEGEGDRFLFVEISDGGFQRFERFTADSDDVETGGGEFAGACGEFLELFDAVETSRAEIEDEDDGFAAELFEGEGFSRGGGETPGGGGAGAGLPAEGAEGIEVGTEADVGGGSGRSTPVGGEFELFSEGLEAGEDREVEVSGASERAEFFEFGG